MARASMQRWLARIAPDLAAVAKDFPLPASIAVLLSVYAQLDLSDFVPDGWERATPVYLTATAASLASGAAHYFAQSRGWRWSRDVALAMAVSIAVGLLGGFGAASGVSFLFLIPALWLALMIAGFLRADATQAALWVANLRLGVAFVLGSLAGIAFAVGISAIAAALHYLFEVDVDDDFYSRVWVAAMTLVSPLYGLALAPRDLAEEIDVEAPPDRQVARGVAALVHYLLVPLVLVFALLLHAYAATIAVAGELPKNLLGGMVTGFALGGTATWLVAWPWRERGGRLLRFFVRGWFALTVVPAILVALAIGTRIREFGVTADRYGVVVVAVWVAAIAGYLALRRRTADMRVILGVLALLLLVGSAGPLGAYAVSARDQVGRLVELLKDAGALAPDGRLVEPVPRFERDVEERIASILESLDTYQALERLGPLFEGRAANPFSEGPNDDLSLLGVVAEAMNARVGAAAWSGDFFSFSASRPIRRAIAEASQLIGPIEISVGESKRLELWPFELAQLNERFSVRRDRRDYSIDSSILVEAIPHSTSAKGPPVEVSVTDDLTVLITRMNGYRGGSKPVQGMTFWLLFRARVP